MREVKEDLEKTLIPIPRFFCKKCGKTTSVLPECIPPRRWYLWAEQHTCLLLLLTGSSFRKVSKSQTPSRHTIKRWQYELIERSEEFSVQLKSKFSWLGYHANNYLNFWKACLDKMSLSTAMYTLNQMGVNVP